MKANQLEAPLKALHFAIDFSQTDLSRARLSRVQNGVVQFICRPHLPELGDGLGQGWGMPFSIVSKEGVLVPVPSLPPRAELERIQADVRGLLNDIVGNPGAVFPVKLPTLNFLLVQPKSWKPIKAGKLIASVGGSTRDRFLYRMIRLLEELGVEKLHVCQAPAPRQAEKKCGKFFFKVTQKKFCSTRCQSRVNSRNYYQKNLSSKSRKGHLHGKTTRTR